MALLLIGVILALAFALPLFYLIIVVGQSPGAAWEAVWRPRTLELLLRSAGLALAVTATTIAIAVPAAWLTTRTDLPGKKIWSVILTLPLVIPSYIGAYLLISAMGPRGLAQQLLEGPFGIERLPPIYGFFGAWLALTLFTYPYVLLPVRTVLMRLNPQLEEAAMGMGRSTWTSFRTVVLPQLVPAIGAGGLLVALYVLSDFGAVSLMRFDSFTRVIYTSYSLSFDRTGAASLALILVLLTTTLLALEYKVRAGGRYTQSGSGRPPRRYTLGRWRWPATAYCIGLAMAALILPIAILLYWLTQSFSGQLDSAELLRNALHSLLASGSTAVIAALLAIPVAILAVRYAGFAGRWIERLSFTGYALPGVVVALSLVYFGTRVAQPVYQTLPLLIFSFVVLFIPIAIGTTRASLLQISPSIEEVARSLGRKPFSVLRTITVRLAAPGVLAGAALVFLTAIKELPATLILAPIGFETLATEIWRATNVGFFERAAAPSLALLVVSALPLYLLTLRRR